MKRTWSSFALSFLVVLACRADTITVDPADAQVETSGGDPAEAGDAGNYQTRVGEYYSPGYSAYVMPFLLPTLGVGEAFDTATLRIQLYSLAGTPDFNGDLYGLGRRASATVLAGDFYNGAFDSGATLIQDDFLNPSSPVRTDPNTGPFITTDTAGSAALVAYLNTQYAGGAGAGEYVFLRINPDATGPQGNESYNVLTANAGGGNEKPLLTYTAAVVPEPASLVLFAAGALALLRVRKAA